MKKFLLAGTALLTGLPASGALAQTVAPANAGLGEFVLEEIVVTAVRAETLLSKTPVSVSAVSADNLRDQGISDPTNLADAVPNLTIDRVNGAGVQITIRGVSSTDNSEKGDPSAAFLVDGVYIARPQAQEVSFFDLERVEVLRGPQGTLYGRNTTAGLVNLISARPKDKFQASGDLTYGSYDTLQASAMVNVPVDDNIAIRAAANYNYRDSYLYEGASTASLDPGKKDLSFRLSAKADIGERVRLYVKGDTSTMKGNPQTGVALSNFFQMPITAAPNGQRGATPVRLSNQSSRELRSLGFTQNRKSTADNSTWGIHGELEVDIVENLTATYLGSYREFTRDELQRGYVGLTYQALPGLPPPGARVPLEATFNGDYEQQSHELRFAYQTDRLLAQGGVYYFREQSGVEFLLFGTRGFMPGQRGYVYGFPQDPTISKTLGFFGQATFSLTDDLRVTGGLRHTSDDKSRVGATINHANVGDPLDFTPATQPGTTNPRGQRDSLNNAAVSYTKLTWRAGLDYDLTEETMLYGNVSTGYKAGGFNEGCLAGQQNCNAPVPAGDLFYSPETLTAYEAGVKTSLADRKVRLTGAYFHYDYSNLQLSQISATYCDGAPCLVTSNAGKAKIDGVEVEALAQPDARNRFNLSLAWLNARYTDYLVSPGVNLKGEQLDRSPKWTATLGYDHTLPVGEGSLVLGARSRISGGYHLINTALRNFFRQPSFTRTDLTATYNAPGDRYYIQAYAKNLENDIALGSVALSANYPAMTDGTAQISDPRTFGVRAGFRF
ncbi:TonB-dependent receptor [Niveispirillum fermenti]|uniref:TonB-dependent receptor n=1 Tax=Niveispirillum fermenti TaxID=1233113 RepID=UPI003A85FBA8